MKRILAILLTFIGNGILCGDLAAQNGFKRDLVLHYTFDKSETADKVDAANSTDSDQNNSDQNKSDEPSILNIAGNFHSGKPLRAKFVDEKSSGRSLRLRQNSEKSGYVETADHKDFKSAKFTVAAWIKLDRTGSSAANPNGLASAHSWKKERKASFPCSLGNNTTAARRQPE